MSSRVDEIKIKIQKKKKHGFVLSQVEDFFHKKIAINFLIVTIMKSIEISVYMFRWFSKSINIVLQLYVVWLVKSA